jgi:hypothetical protein
LIFPWRRTGSIKFAAHNTTVGDQAPGLQNLRKRSAANSLFGVTPRAESIEIGIVFQQSSRVEGTKLDI